MPKNPLIGCQRCPEIATASIVVTVVVERPGRRDDEVTGLHRGALAVHCREAAVAFHHEAHRGLSMSVRRRNLLRQDQLDGSGQSAGCSRLARQRRIFEQQSPALGLFRSKEVRRPRSDRDRHSSQRHTCGVKTPTGSRGAIPATPPTAEQSIARQSDRRILSTAAGGSRRSRWVYFDYLSVICHRRSLCRQSGCGTDFYPGGLLSRGFKIRQLSGNITFSMLNDLGR